MWLRILLDLVPSQSCLGLLGKNNTHKEAKMLIYYVINTKEKQKSPQMIQHTVDMTDS